MRNCLTILAVFSKSSTIVFLVDSSLNFLIDFLMLLNILLLTLEMLTFSLSGLILTNLQLSSVSIYFCLCLL